MDLESTGSGIDRRACGDYVLARQCEDAGFCFYRAWGVEESNPADTYYAITSLVHLMAPIPRRSAVIQWLRERQLPAGDFSSLVVAWYVLEALNQLDQVPLKDPRRYLRRQREDLGYWPQDPSSASDALRALARLIRLCTRWDVPLPPKQRRIIGARVQGLRATTGGYGRPHASLVDSYRAAMILEMLGCPIETSLLVFLEQCQDLRLGFRLVPGSTLTSLEVARAGLCLSQSLHAPVPMPLASVIRRFALACQRADGGFGRTPGAISTLEDTCLALEILLHPCLTTPARLRP